VQVFSDIQKQNNML